MKKHSLHNTNGSTSTTFPDNTSCGSSDDCDTLCSLIWILESLPCGRYLTSTPEVKVEMSNLVFVLTANRSMRGQPKNLANVTEHLGKKGPFCKDDLIQTTHLVYQNDHLPQKSFAEMATMWTSDHQTMF